MQSKNVLLFFVYLVWLRIMVKYNDVILLKYEKDNDKKTKKTDNKFILIQFVFQFNHFFLKNISSSQHNPLWTNDYIYGNSRKQKQKQYARRHTQL